ncbi:hypothetical protein ACFFX0_13510 [Citricoccus parietis]|uniref:Uncharacterized protein n=1 Tax=Citricoccus parietis TaxID=592307 RepID=A0ABV5FZP4_9MICC
MSTVWSVSFFRPPPNIPATSAGARSASITRPPAVPYAGIRAPIRGEARRTWADSIPSTNSTSERTSTDRETDSPVAAASDSMGRCAARRISRFSITPPARESRAAPGR